MNHRRYSQHARRALNHALLLAKESGHAQVDSTHLLVGILNEAGSIGTNILLDLAMDVRRTERAFRQLPPLHLTEQMESKIGSTQADSPDAPGNSTMPSNSVNPANPPLSAALREVLELADQESRGLGQHYVGTEHMLLGLTRQGEEGLLALLHAVEISPEQIRRRARRLLQEGITEISVEQAKRVARLSELTRRVLNAAEQTAAQMHHRHVGLVHLLLVMSRERRSICSRLLLECGMDAQALEANLVKPRPASGGLLDDVIDRAVARAEGLGSHYTGTDHVLLSLAETPRGARLLRKYGVDPERIARQLRDVLVR